METEIMEVVAKAVDTPTFQIATDWNIFWVTLAAGVLSALATVIAVIYTHRKTSKQYKETMKVNEQRYVADVERNEQRHAAELERYKADKKRQEREMALVVIKPSLKYAAFYQLRDKLIVDGNEERTLLLSSKEGFEFYDDRERQGEPHSIFSIRNESRNSIRFVNIDVSSTVKTKSDEEISDNYKNVVGLLRKDEEIILRIHNSSQRKKLLECLEKNETVETIFECTINYLTLANQQICYEYSIKITDTQKDRKTEIKKDEFTPMDEISIDVNEPASYFRDLQENLRADRFGYKYQRIGEEQMNGTLAALRRFFVEQGLGDVVEKATNTMDSMDKSMQDSAKTMDALLELFNELKRNQGTPRLTGDIDSVEENIENEN